MIQPDETEPVNVLDYFKAIGLDDNTAYHLVLHMLLTRTYAYEAEARQAARELGIDIPYVFPDFGNTH